MAKTRNQSTVREAVGVFGDQNSYQNAIDELLLSGFSRPDLSFLASEHTVKKKLGHEYEKVKDAEDDPKIPRKAYVAKESIGDAEGSLFGGLLYIGAMAATGIVVASGGTMAAALTAAVLAGGTGGVIGGYLAHLVGKHHADLLQEQLDHGGLLLWVNLRDKNHETRAIEILKKHSGKDVHVHDIRV
jgi:hypothetical protein